MFRFKSHQFQASIWKKCLSKQIAIFHAGNSPLKQYFMKLYWTFNIQAKIETWSIFKSHQKKWYSFFVAAAYFSMKLLAVIKPRGRNTLLIPRPFNSARQSSQQDFKNCFFSVFQLSSVNLHMLVLIFTEARTEKEVKCTWMLIFFITE